MNLNKKIIAGAVVATLAITSSGLASAHDTGRGHVHPHNHSRSHDSGDNAGKIAGIILGAAIIGSVIAHANSQSQPTYAQPSYAPSDSYSSGSTTYSYSQPTVYRESRVVYVESPRYHGHSHHRHHHGGWSRH